MLGRPGLRWPADLYLEGSDQYRGWFQSSLLVGIGTRGESPYRADLTHGFVVDEQGEFIRREERLLLNSVDMTLEQAAARVTVLGGLAIPAHVNRKANGLIEVLGLVPPGFETLEISRHISPEAARQKYPQLAGHTLVQNGDVHFLDGFLGRTEFEIEAPTLAEIRQALGGQNGRKMRVR